ncbi:DNA polymerase III subunit gamma/tau [Flavobacterium anhuiense]|uniref:DNA polymerase III subunit gamma/tau n=1 Tax=Flavobacterium anhuiense TaxID=459526 RepID=UPI0021B394AB|nr:DNA polymerase III subunit gamma/tau [Flavobacterium anhuiense]
MEKKKAEQFIIPPVYFRNGGYSIVEVQSPQSKTESAPATENQTSQAATQTETVTSQPEKAVQTPQVQTPQPPKTETDGTPKVSAFSLASIRKKKELEASSKTYVKPSSILPTEEFNETDMRLHWNKYAERLGQKGLRIMESILLISDPVLNGTTISYELPNEGSKLEFESQMNGLLGHLKGHLHNHDITIEVIVNEQAETKKTYNNQDRYNRFMEINPNIELLRSTFGLDLKD